VKHDKVAKKMTPPPPADALSAGIEALARRMSAIYFERVLAFARGLADEMVATGGGMPGAEEPIAEVAKPKRKPPASVAPKPDRRAAIAERAQAKSPAAGPKKRSTMRCSKCGELGFRSDGCGRTHNVVKTMDDADSDDEEGEAAILVEPPQEHDATPAPSETDAVVSAVVVVRPVLVRSERWHRSIRNREMPRSTTLSIKRMGPEVRRAEPIDDAELAGRPRTRGDCCDGPRPCPWVACRHHLYIDVDPERGSIKLNFPDLEPDQLAESCSLDVAERGPQILEVVGAIMNLTRERARQIETKSLFAASAAAARAHIREDSLSGFPHPESNAA
jgi:hypothetical protein